MAAGPYTTYEDGTECSETSAYKIQKPKNHQKKEYNRYKYYLLFGSSEFRV